MRNTGLLLLAILGIGCGTSSPSGTGGTGGVSGNGNPDLATSSMLDLAGVNDPLITGSCDYRALSPQTAYCQDYTAATSIIATYKSSCAGKWSDAACGHDQSIGGCTESHTSPPITITNWFYMGGPYTVDTLKMGCASSHGTYVAP